VIVTRHDRAKARSAQVRARAAKMAKLGKARKAVRPRYPLGAETRYRRELFGVLAGAREIVARRLKPVIADIFDAASNTHKADSAVRRADDYASIINDVFGEIRLEFERRFKRPVREAAENAGKRTAEANKADQQRVFKSLLGVDVIGREQWLGDFVDLFTTSNVRLIKSIPEKYFAELEDLVRDAAVTGKRPEAFADDLEERYGVSRSKAKLLARDQVGKFNGELTRVRQGRLGIKSFIWRTSQDERVRDSHKAKEGNSYDWDSPPNDTGIPGADYQCRCTAEPVIDLDDLESDTF
jgi:SPP1 gp7 family putative phage head morphogenesis protein